MKLVNPGNKRKFEVIVVGTGLAGASAAASMAQLGYKVKVFTFHDSPRRAHSIAAQGGINAAKNYPNDGDSIYRLFYDTVKGGDFRARESNVYRLAQVSVDIIDQCVAQGVPFAREYGGLLDNRSFGGAQVSRTFYARGQTGQQLLLGAYQALEQQVSLGNVRLHTKTEMLDVVVKDGKACGIVTRDLVSGEISSHSAHAVVLATGGYSNAFYLSTNAMNCNVTAAWRAHKKGAMFANPCFTQIHPTCIPSSDEFQSKLTLMSESLRNDGRIWVPKDPDETRSPDQIPEADRDYFLERKYPAFGNLVPRDVASRNAKTMVDAGYGRRARSRTRVYLDFGDAIERLGESVDPRALREPLRHVRAHHRREPVQGADAHLPRHPLHDGRAVGRLQPHDHRARASTPSARPTSPTRAPTGSAPRRSCRAWPTATSCCPTRSATTCRGCSTSPPCRTDDPEFQAAEAALHDRHRPLAVGRRHQVGRPLPPRARQDHVGLLRHGPRPGRAREGPLRDPRPARGVRARTSGCSARPRRVNQSLEKVQRVADFFELAELMCRDALMREECCGGHFRVEHQTEEGEAERDDEHFAFVGAWDWQGKGSAPGAPQGAARVRLRPPHPEELQVAMDLHLKIWRQDGPTDAGRFEDYEAVGINEDMSFLEMLDVINERLIAEGREPIVFDSDCREGICGTCGLMINGQAHGPEKGTATCQLHMRKFTDGEHVTIEPWRAAAFPVIRDLMVDRSPLDAIIEAGGYISANTGSRGRRQRHPDPQAGGRRGHGRGGLHRLRRLRRGLPQQRRPSCSPRPRSATSTCCPRARPSGGAARRTWSTPWRSSSGPARTTASARRRARRRSASTSSPT